MKLLLADALNRLDPAVLPAVQPEQLLWINGVLETFYAEGQWARTTTKWKGLSTSSSFAIQFDAFNQAFFTLPRHYLCMMAGGYGQSNVQPGAPNYRILFSKAPIQGMWHQSGNSGPGFEDSLWGMGITDLGDEWTSFADITAPSYLKVITETTETNPTNILFRGVDQNGNQIYSGTGAGTSIGCTLNIGASQTTQTTQIFGASPYTVQKPVTNGPVNLYAVNVATGLSTLIAIYAPGETSPSYRRYALGGTARPGQQPFNAGNTCPYTSVQAIVKRRFVPVVALSDELIPSSLPALTNGMLGWQYDLQRDAGTADKHWATAINLLNAELTQYNGAATPQVAWQRGASLGRIASI